MQISAQEDRLDRLTQLGEGSVGRMLHVLLGKAAQDGFGFGRPRGSLGVSSRKGPLRTLSCRGR